MRRRVPHCALELLNPRDLWDRWHARKRGGQDDVFGVEGSGGFAFFRASLHGDFPFSSRRALGGGNHIGVSPCGQLESTRIPLKPVAHLGRWSVGWPVLWKGKVGEVVSPVWQVKGQIFISIAPVVTDPLVAFHDETAHPESLQTCGDLKAAVRFLIVSINIPPIAPSDSATNSRVSSTDDHNVRLDTLQVVLLGSLSIPGLIPSHVAIVVRNLRMAMEAFDDRVESPNFVAGLCLDKVQDSTGVDEVRVERVYYLKPGQVRIGSCDRWRGIDQRVVAGWGSREQIGRCLFNVLRRVK